MVGAAGARATLAFEGPEVLLVLLPGQGTSLSRAHSKLESCCALIWGIRFCAARNVANSQVLGT